MTIFKKKSGVSTVEVDDDSQSSATSRPPGVSGPSTKEPALITSTWGIGWQTITAMIVCYALALLLACLHLIMFQYINGKEATGPNRVAPQSYISMASNILSNTFGFSLRASLALAFVQRLWLLLRLHSMKVSTIEALFSVRSNPFMLFNPSAIAATPILCLLAVLMWISQFVTSLPPGAITVIQVQKTSYGVVQVPSFNASFMGNGSGADADAYSLTNLAAASNLTPNQSGFMTTDYSTNKNTNLINLLARQILVAGTTFPMPSPCGANCSYTITFEGPYMNCNSTRDVAYYDDATGYFDIYTGKWFSPPQQSMNPALFYNGTYTQARFNATTLYPIQVNGTDQDGNSSSALIHQDRIICAPGRANFTVINTYENNILSRNVTSKPIDTLISLVTSTHGNTVIVPGFPAANGTGLGTTPANWSSHALNYYRDTNMMIIHGSVFSWLNGTFQGFFEYNPTLPTVGPSKAPQPAYNPLWRQWVTTTKDGQAVNTAVQYGTVVDSTRFNGAFGHFSLSENSHESHPSFNVTQDLINEYLFNMTTSLMVSYNLWSTNANATINSTVTVYSFSQPLSLVLPYFITLFVSMPFLVMGCLALFKNGVSAMDGSFMQIIATSTGSAALDRAAAGGCLGGNESMPQELKDLKVKFGEFIMRDEPGGVKRAGFGVENEVKRLDRGQQYGIKKWI